MTDELEISRPFAFGRCVYCVSQVLAVSFRVKSGAKRKFLVDVMQNPV